MLTSQLITNRSNLLERVDQKIQSLAVKIHRNLTQSSGQNPNLDDANHLLDLKDIYMQYLNCRDCITDITGLTQSINNLINKSC